MIILTQQLFQSGCQFQEKVSKEKSPLYVTEIMDSGSLILLDYKFACEYGKQPWVNLSQVFYLSPEYFVFHYSLLGDIEVVQRYYRDFQVVNYKKHSF